MNWPRLPEACSILLSRQIPIWSGLSDQKEKAKTWYDGFTFGSYTDIYNPWSAINFLDKGKVGTYWANTSANGLAGKLIREGGRPSVILIPGRTRHRKSLSAFITDLYWD